MDIFWLLFICTHCVRSIFYVWFCNTILRYNLWRNITARVFPWNLFLLKKILPFSLPLHHRILHPSMKHQWTKKLFTLFIVFYQIYVYSMRNLRGKMKIWTEDHFLTRRKFRPEYRAVGSGGIGGQNCGTKFLGKLCRGPM